MTEATAAEPVENLTNTSCAALTASSYTPWTAPLDVQCPHHVINQLRRVRTCSLQAARTVASAVAIKGATAGANVLAPLSDQAERKQRRHLLCPLFLLLFIPLSCCKSNMTGGSPTRANWELDSIAGAHLFGAVRPEAPHCPGDHSSGSG